MEDSIITVVEPSKCRTSIRKIKGKTMSVPESTPIDYYCQIREGDRTIFPERFPRKLNRGYGRTYADSRAAFAAQRQMAWTPVLQQFPVAV